MLIATTTAAKSLASAAGVTLAAWVVLLEVLAFLSRPRRPHAGPVAMIDVPDTAEPPAVVNYLVNACRATDAGVAATLLDLAAHHYLTIDERGPDDFVCHLPAKNPSLKGLRPYERAVLDHVRSLAVDGVVPCQALTTGPQDEAAAWRKTYNDAVAKDARERGLTRSRWSRFALVTLGVTAIVPVVLLVSALAAMPPSSRQSSNRSNSPGGYVFAAVVGWIFLMAVLALFRSNRETTSGRRVWARWLGLRDYFLRDENFQHAPPAAVATWDRYLAYGAALGVAFAAVRALPFGAESDRVAWSSYGGGWRQVHIRYPHSPARPGWGWSPARAVLFPLVFLVPVAVMARVLQSAVKHHVLNPHTWSNNLRTGYSIGMVVLGVVVVYALLTWLRVLVGGVADLFFRTDVTGEILRVRNFGNRHYVAVDPGQDDHIVAWNVVRPSLLSGPGQGAIVRARVGRVHGYVYAIDPLPPASPHVSRQSSAEQPKAVPPVVAPEPSQ